MPPKSDLGDYELQRYPLKTRGGLRAWNSADLLLLQAAVESGIPVEHILLVNDEHGALAVPLAGSCIWTDSRLAELAILHNYRNNHISEAPRFCSMDHLPEGHFELVLLRIPKQLSLLRYQLQSLRQLLPSGCKVLCAGMDKHLPRGVADLVEEFLGTTQRHPGSKKARMFSVAVDKNRTGSEADFRAYYLPEIDAEIESAVNVFSREKLDAGSRLMLGQYARLPAARNVVDLGCGNGVLGLVAAARLRPESLVFIDESSLCLASARRNAERLLGDQQACCEFLHADGLKDYHLPAPDLVLCNPPFHQQHVVDESSGQRMIRQAAAAIAPGGELWLVANRHLPYAGLLQRSFGQLSRIAEDNKFIVWRAVGAG
jgi:16S rRNA G1207 methylase RsmC